MMKDLFSIGDRVAYRAAFLRFLLDYSYASASRRGTVVDPEAFPGDPHFVRIQWDDKHRVGAGVGDGETTTIICTRNIIHADRIHLEPA